MHKVHLVGQRRCGRVLVVAAADAAKGHGLLRNGGRQRGGPQQGVPVAAHCPDRGGGRGADHVRHPGQR